MLWFAVFVLVSILVGAFAIPAYVYLVSPGMPSTIVARILWTAGAIGLGPYVAYRRATGQTEIWPADPDEGVMFVDGEPVDLDDEHEWGYLGKSLFGITYEKSEDYYGDLRIDEETGPGAGGLVDSNTYGGESVAVGVPRHSQLGDYAVNIRRLAQRIEDMAAPKLIDSGIQEALVDHGGAGEMPTKLLIVAIIGSMLAGGVMGYITFFL